MTRERTTTALRAGFSEIRQRFGVRHISLFGSVARDDDRSDSDVDVLVEFEASPSFRQYMGLKMFLEDLLQRSVDVATLEGLKPRLKQRIASEVVNVA
jgi:uncharacterized protein